MFRANVHEVNAVAANFGSFLFNASGNTFVKEPIVIVERFVSLSDDKNFFLVGSHIAHVVSNFVINFVDFAVWSFHETELINAGVVGKRAD